MGDQNAYFYAAILTGIQFDRRGLLRDQIVETARQQAEADRWPAAATPSAALLADLRTIASALPNLHGHRWVVDDDGRVWLKPSIATQFAEYKAAIADPISAPLPQQPPPQRNGQRNPGPGREPTVPRWAKRRRAR